MRRGFGSIRRFNETFQRLFGRPPLSLRRKAAPDGRLGRHAPLSVSLSYRPPYDFDAMLEFLAARAIPGVEDVSAGRYARSIAVGRDHGVLTVEPDTGHRLKVGIRFPRLGALATIIARTRRVFDLAADPAVIGAHLSQDPLLAPLVAARRGLRVPGGWTALSSRCGRSSASRSRCLSPPACGRLVRAHGMPLSQDLASPFMSLTHVFPPPERLVTADLAALGSAEIAGAGLVVAGGGGGRRSPYLRPRTRPRGGDRPSSDRSRHRRVDGAIHRHARAARTDAFPAADIGLMRALADPEGRRPSPGELIARAERWRPLARLCGAATLGP